MDYLDKDFDEIEPRIVPQRTVLKCTTAPSVPEVSLIFQKRSSITEPPTKTRDTPDGRGEAYAKWRKDGFPAIIDSRVSNVSNDGASKHPSNFYAEPGGINNTGTFFSNTAPIPCNKENEKIVDHKRCSVGGARNNWIDDKHVYNYELSSRNEICRSAFPRNELVDASVQNRSHDTIKSILKNCLSNNTTAKNPKLDYTVSSDRRFQSKTPSNHHQTPRYIDDSPHSPRSPVPRCQHTNEINRDNGTVRDLLLIVQNQNEQIKSLQTQVEILLKTHERNIGHFENGSSVKKKSNGKLQSPGYRREPDTFSENNMVSAETTCHSRAIKMSTNPSDEQTELCLRYQCDPLRNTIMEKKVSIGVMTSFEFSVQNNPFVSDNPTDHQINAALRDSGKNINDSGEGRRSNLHCSRKGPTEPLENISEDSESHSPSIRKQSGNNNQVSPSEKSTFTLTAKVNNDQVDHGDALGCSPISEVTQPEPSPNDSSVMFFNKPTHHPVRIRNCRSHKGQARLPVLLDQKLQNGNSPEGSRPDAVLEQKKMDLCRDYNLNNYNRTTDREFSRDSCLNEDDRKMPRYCEQSENEIRSIVPDNTTDGSFVLRSSDLRVTDRSPPSPDPSIHVEMREYSSDEENEKRSPAVGWTFYKNVVGQVNRILHTIPDTQEANAIERINPPTINNDIVGDEDILNSVKSATLDRLKMLGISYREHTEFNGEHTQKKVTFDSSHCLPLDYQASMQPTQSVTETNTSMHMKALALKYLSDEQLADFAVHKQGHGTTMKHAFLSVHGTNMSLATMNYLQRYCLVSGMNPPNVEVKGHGTGIRQKTLKHLVMTKELLAQSTNRDGAFENSVNKGAPENILNITTLKQQPKLL